MCIRDSHAIDILKRLIQGGSKTHRPVGHKTRDVVVANAADHAAWNNLPVAAGGVCGKRGADRFGAAAVLPVLSVRPARQHAGGARGCRIAGARWQAMGSGDRSDELGFWQDHDQHPDDLGDMNGMGIPLLWMLLPTAGNSHTSERTELLDRLRAAFPDMKIAALMGDREFIGDAWMAYLQRQNIPFILRLRENQHVLREGYAAMSIAAIARHLR